jgi:hypothetical protein
MSPQNRSALATRLAAMSRAELVRILRGMHCTFQLDFTDEFLRTVSLERLRHIILAASLHERRCPDHPTGTTA